MSNLLSFFGKSRRGGAPEPTPAERLLAYRERLLGCALQLLEDPQAAQDVVVRGLVQALRSPLLLTLSELTEEPALLRWLDRLVVNLCLSRLRDTAPSRPVAEGVTRGSLPTESPGPEGQKTHRPEAEPAEAREAREGDDGRAPIDLRNQRAAQKPRPALAGQVRRADILSVAGLGEGRRAGGPRSRGTDRSGSPAGPPAEILQLQRMAQVLHGLSPETRVTVVLLVMQGRSLAEVAEILGCSEMTCAFWLNHGRKLLRRALQRDLLGEDHEPPGTHAEALPGAIHDLRRGKKAAARA